MEQWFFDVAEKLPQKRFLLGGNGWVSRAVPPNVRRLGHLYTADHNAFNSSPLAVLNISRESMARTGYSPATRIFEAAGAGACIVSDAWEGIEQFLEPGKEILIAHNGAEVVQILRTLTPDRSALIGASALERVKAEHTYRTRAEKVSRILEGLLQEDPRPIRTEMMNPPPRIPGAARHIGDHPLEIVIIGLSLSSSWGNGHATTYRSLVKGLRQEGHNVHFLEKDVEWYRSNRDLHSSPHCKLHFYSHTDELIRRFNGLIGKADLVITGSYLQDGIRIGDWVQKSARISAFYDIDTPVTLAKLEQGECPYLHPEQIPGYNLYLSFTGGEVLRELSLRWGSPLVRPLYCSVDPERYHPEQSESLWSLGYLGTYSEDRQPTLEALLLETARKKAEEDFIVAGPQYPEWISWPQNVTRIEHLPPGGHLRFYNSQKFTLNVTRQAMVAAGYSPSVRLFEAAACGTPVISDRWKGLESFFEPVHEILLAASSEEVVELLALPFDERRNIGLRARKRVLQEHSSRVRAQQLLRYYREIEALSATRRALSG